VRKDQYLTVLRSDSAALAEAAGIDLTAAVPSCPGWSVADLVVHTGLVHRSQANIVKTRAQEPTGMKREMLSSVPGLLEWFEASVFFGGTTNLEAIPPGLIEWFQDGAAELEDVLREANPDEPVWSWSDTKRVAHYLRMMPIETAVHRWDAQLANGRPAPIDRALAVDGIDHTFDVMLPFRREMAKAPNGSGESYRFVQTDGRGRWLVRFEPDRVEIDRDGTEGEADITIHAAASDLFLLLWHRLSAHLVTAEGDARHFDRYFELVPPV
jgi:uncharacterized protein (TIGR03083 family)